MHQKHSYFPSKWRIINRFIEVFESFDCLIPKLWIHLCLITSRYAVLTRSRANSCKVLTQREMDICLTLKRTHSFHSPHGSRKRIGVSSLVGKTFQISTIGKFALRQCLNKQVFLIKQNSQTSHKKYWAVLLQIDLDFFETFQRKAWIFVGMNFEQLQLLYN